MALTPSLNITTVEDAQDNKEVTINDALIALDKATNATTTVDMSGGNVTIPAPGTPETQDNQQLRYLCTGQTEDRALIVPQKPKFFAVTNASASFNVDVTRGTTVIEVGTETTMLFYTDGMANGLVSIAGGGGAGGVSSSVQTTDATVTTLVSMPVATGESVAISLFGMAIEPANEQAIAFNVLASASNTGGTTRLNGSVVNIASNPAETPGPADWVVVADIDDATDVLRVRVTGEAGTTIDWEATTQSITRS